ncbi:hypothetical protein HS7_17600 [Sulfolobales archaeon HS-7]|nr:hypothetical protein HS7_17600 [Sulfolobales archaeon HS-7]
MGGAIPFIYVGGFCYQVGTMINPTLMANTNWSFVISQLTNPSSPISEQVYSEASVLTAEICSVDGNSPSSVCGAHIIMALEAKLKNKTNYQTGGNVFESQPRSFPQVSSKVQGNPSLGENDLILQENENYGLKIRFISGRYAQELVQHSPGLTRTTTATS